jgi:hypothetical protein
VQEILFPGYCTNLALFLDVAHGQRKQVSADGC